MNGSLAGLSRCAIYTRKSTEHNLDLAFTSLDAPSPNASAEPTGGSDR